jgi:hypothetical protein
MTLYGARTTLIAALAAVLIAGIGAGFGVAIASSKQPSYKACANSHGVLSLESHGKCSKGSKHVNLGERGPAGATGPSDVYASYGKINTIVPYFSTFAPVVSVHVPAGKYFAEGSIYISGNIDDSVICDVTLSNANGAGNQSIGDLTPKLDGYKEGTLTPMAPLDLIKPSTVQISCASEYNSSSTTPDKTIYSQLEVIKAGALHVANSDTTPLTD